MFVRECQGGSCLRHFILLHAATSREHAIDTCLVLLGLANRARSDRGTDHT